VVDLVLLLGDHVLIDWSKEEFIEGAYSYPTMEETNNNHREILTKNINGKVFFAGEAINPENHSTIGAALQSALRVANEIVKLNPLKTAETNETCDWGINDYQFFDTEEFQFPKSKLLNRCVLESVRN